MIKYECIVCEFETQKKTNYERHLSSERHKLIYKNHILKTSKIFNCNTCNYKTIKQTDYKRHLLSKKHLNKTSIQINNLNNQNPVQDILNKLDTVEQTQNEKTELLMKEIEKLRELNEQNTNKINETNNQNTHKLVKEARLIKQSMLTLLNTHFKDTPSIEYIKQEPFFEALEEEYNAKINDGSDKLFMRIFTDYEKKKLVKTLSDLILKFVKKDDQKFQSVFNIDSARFNFATKIDDFWMNDKKGIKLRKFTIDKVVNFMIDVLEVFRLRLVRMRKENIIKSTIERSDYLMTNQKLLFEVVNFLNHPSTHTKIITELSPNLRYEYDEQLLLDHE